MLSFKHKFLFVHLPKTAGNSIQTILSPYSEDKIVCLNELQDGVERFEIRNKFTVLRKHSALIDYKDLLPQDCYDNLFKFATIRNPWDRMVSFFFSPHRQVDQWNKSEFIQLVESVITLPELLKIDDITPWHKSVDQIMKFENLDTDFSTLCKKIGISDTSLPIRNKSNRYEYQRYYDDELISIVAKKFRDEIDFGQYQF